MPVIPQYVPTDENRGSNLVAYWWVTITLVALVVAFRIYVRVIIRKTPGWDDWLICIALITHIISTGVSTVAVRYGLGHHIYYLDNHEMEFYARWIIGAETAALFTSVFAKTSICVSVLRVTPNAQRAIVTTFWTFIAFLVATSSATMLVLLLQCVPLRKVWDPSIPGSCISLSVVKWVFQGYGITGCITDFACAVLPAFVIRHHHIERSTKVALILLLGLALFPCICCILKTIEANEVLSSDQSWDAYSECIWWALETNSGIVIACLPVLYPGFHSMFNAALDHLEKSPRLQKSRALYYITQNRTTWRSQATTVRPSPNPPQTAMATAKRGSSHRESYFDISKLFHSPETRHSDSIPSTFRTIPPSPPPKDPPTPPPKCANAMRTSRLSTEERAAADLRKTSLMPHDDLKVFPTRNDKDYEERVLRRVQALVSPGPSKTASPNLPV